MSRNVIGKYSHKCFDHPKKSATNADTIKTALKKALHLATKTTSNLTGNKISEKVTKFSKRLLHNNLQIV